MNRAAFFDLDNTVLTINSGSVWMKRDYREGRLSLRHLGRAMVSLARYAAGSLDVEGAMQEWLKLTRQGTLEADERDRIERWWRDYLAPTVSSSALAAMDEHRRRGDLVVLATSSTVYQAEVVARELEFDEFVATHWEVADGYFTGELVRPICYAQGKLDRVRALCDRYGLELDNCWAYSDSITDEPLLEAVGHANAINPDRRLRELARKRGWQCIAWS